MTEHLPKHPHPAASPRSERPSEPRGLEVRADPEEPRGELCRGGCGMRLDDPEYDFFHAVEHEEAYPSAASPAPGAAPSGETSEADRMRKLLTTVAETQMALAEFNAHPPEDGVRLGQSLEEDADEAIYAVLAWWEARRETAASSVLVSASGVERDGEPSDRESFVAGYVAARQDIAEMGWENAELNATFRAHAIDAFAARVRPTPAPEDGR